MPEPRVLIAQPLYAHVAPVAVAAWTVFVLKLAERGYAVFQSVNMYIDQVRNDAVKHALGESKENLKGITHLLFCDSDMVLPTDGLDKLLALQKPITSGLYFGKIPPFLPVAFSLKPEFKRLPDYEEDTVMEVDGAGAGFLLIEVEVFRAMRKKFGDDNWFRCGETQAMGEDVWFFTRAHEMGLKCHLDTHVVCGHVAELVVNNATFRNTAISDQILKELQAERAA